MSPGAYLCLSGSATNRFEIEEKSASPSSREATAFPVRISNSKARVVEKAEMFSGFARLLIEWAP